MKYLVFSDVHGNLPALRKMLNAAKDVDGYICLGDAVNYGPWSNECIELIDSLPNRIILKGNHEEYFLSGSYDGDNPVAKEFFNFCYPKFNRFSMIKDLPDSFILGGYVFTHTIRGRYIYPDSRVTLDGNYVIGHSHHQFMISQPPHKLYNTGSVGQNRGHINVIDYMTFDTDTLQFEAFSMKYNPDIVIDQMRKTGYPQVCIDYYNNKPRL